MSDSSRPEFWDQRHAAPRVPWDFGDAAIIYFGPAGGDIA